MRPTGMFAMTEVRCVKCRRLLMKYDDWYGSIEIKCPKCGHVQSVTVMGGMRENIPMITTYIDKPLKDVSTEELTAALADYEGNRFFRIMNIILDVRKELASRETAAFGELAVKHPKECRTFIFNEDGAKEYLS